MTKQTQATSIDYTNWRGERRIRLIKPIGMVFDCNEHHPTPQWMLAAIDIEKNELRFFAMANIHSWRNNNA